MQYKSVRETAERFNVSERRVQKLCETGRIEGAEMVSNVWIIPDNASKPLDERMKKISSEELISLQELCGQLSISIATGRNWIKLGKIVPEKKVGKTAYFSTEYIETLKTSIQNGDNKALKSRRNKKFISGNYIYQDYVSEHSKNIVVVQKLLEYIEIEAIELTDDMMRIMLAECAIQLIRQKHGEINIGGSLRRYLLNEIDITAYMPLVDDIFDKISDRGSLLDKYSELLDFEFKYEREEDILGLLYISLKNIGNRKATGSYYTPTRVVKKLCNNLFKYNSVERKKILDPCCGSGNFLLQLPMEIFAENIYGNDIDKISVKLARINLALKYGIADISFWKEHITELDYLNNDLGRYDYIIGNPPWGYEYSIDEKNELKKCYESAEGANVESYDVFIEKSILSLNANGVLSFVLPEALLNVKAHKKIREVLIRENSFQYLEFLGNAFDKVQCPCIILQIIHTQLPMNCIGMVVNNKQSEYVIGKSREVSPECFSFLTTDEEFQILNKIEEVLNKRTLDGNALFALGIVTGNNKEYISDVKNDENEMVLKGSDLCKYSFNMSENYITFKPDNFQQVAPVELYRAKEKLLYRFICNQLVFAYDNQQTLSLNSCNVVIPQLEGLDIKYIMAVLNSRVAQYFFKKKFNSVKVLRSHIEQIPIPGIEKESQAKIIQLVDTLLVTSCEKSSIYEEIDGMIAELFNLNWQEYEQIKTSLSGENLFLE